MVRKDWIFVKTCDERILQRPYHMHIYVNWLDELKCWNDLLVLSANWVWKFGLGDGAKGFWIAWQIKNR